MSNVDFSKLELFIADCTESDRVFLVARDSVNKDAYIYVSETDIFVKSNLHTMYLYPTEKTYRLHTHPYIYTPIYLDSVKNLGTDHVVTTVTRSYTLSSTSEYLLNTYSAQATKKFSAEKLRERAPLIAKNLTPYFLRFYLARHKFSSRELLVVVDKVTSRAYSYFAEKDSFNRNNFIANELYLLSGARSWSFETLSLEETVKLCNPGRPIISSEEERSLFKDQPESDYFSADRIREFVPGGTKENKIRVSDHTDTKDFTDKPLRGEEMLISLAQTEPVTIKKCPVCNKAIVTTCEVTVDVTVDSDTLEAKVTKDPSVSKLSVQHTCAGNK